MAVLVAASLWGTTGTAQQLGPDSSTSLGVGALRLLIGGAALKARDFIEICKAAGA